MQNFDTFSKTAMFLFKSKVSVTVNNTPPDRVALYDESLVFQLLLSSRHGTEGKTRERDRKQLHRKTGEGMLHLPPPQGLKTKLEQPYLN